MALIFVDVNFALVNKDPKTKSDIVFWLKTIYGELTSNDEIYFFSNNANINNPKQLKANLSLHDTKENVHFLQLASNELNFTQNPVACLLEQALLDAKNAVNFAQQSKRILFISASEAMRVRAKTEDNRVVAVAEPTITSAFSTIYSEAVKNFETQENSKVEQTEEDLSELGSSSGDLASSRSSSRNSSSSLVVNPITGVSFSGGHAASSDKQDDSQFGAINDPTEQGLNHDLNSDHADVVAFGTSHGTSQSEASRKAKKSHALFASILPALASGGKALWRKCCIPFATLAASHERISSKNQEESANNNSNSNSAALLHNSRVSETTRSAPQVPFIPNSLETIAKINELNALKARFLFENRGKPPEEKKYMRRFFEDILEKKNRNFFSSIKRAFKSSPLYERKKQEYASTLLNREWLNAQNLPDYQPWLDERERLQGSANTIRDFFEEASTLKVYTERRDGFMQELSAANVLITQDEPLSEQAKFSLKISDRTVAKITQLGSSVKTEDVDANAQESKQATTALFKDLITTYLNDIKAGNIKPDKADKGFFVIRLSNKDDAEMKNILEFLKTETSKYDIPLKVELCNDATKPVAENNRVNIVDSDERKKLLDDINHAGEENKNKATAKSFSRRLKA